MTHSRRILATLFVLSFVLPSFAQVTREDYERALSMRERYQKLALNIVDAPEWIRGGGHRFWYRKSVEGGNQFILVDADAGTRGPAFDHAKVAESLSSATGNHYTAVTLTFRSPR